MPSEANYLIAEAMQTFIVKSSSANEEIIKPHFFVLNKGMNSGKPLTSFCPNSFKVEATNEKEKEILYWVSFALRRAKAFHPYLVGSVIQFIRIGDFSQLITEKMEVVKANPEEFEKTVNKLRFIELKEKQFLENLKLIQELKSVYVHNYFNRKR